MNCYNNLRAAPFSSALVHVPDEYHKNNRRTDSNSVSASHNVDPDLVSDGESSTSTISSEPEIDLFSGDLIRINNGQEKDLQLVTERFLSWSADKGLNAEVKAVHKNGFSSLTSQAKLRSFVTFLRVMEKKNEGCANLEFAWFGGSKDEINGIFEHGFGHTSKNLSYGHGIYLSPLESPTSSFQSCVVDGDGLSHLVLCRVILGRPELVRPGSSQDRPSSKEFDSGVDNLSSPERYIVWDTYKNTHILPQYVISFRCPPNLNGFHKNLVPMRKPNSPWMPIPLLISELAKFLPHNAINLLQKHYGDFRGGKITREELIRKVRLAAGDELLFKVIKSYRDKAETLKQASQSNMNKCKRRIQGMMCVCSKKSENRQDKYTARLT
ncbi:OLC1v1011439C1 [Oldenlandia corymbosa var. corymbosa]|uniref:OLC1v1011439C1 n=1 Tax=Oldenlandia corymbosa var. corymbosa TaxID=529605 RepID=A0AAV1DTN6_OLDCO|nr:OLC1v1011439C1 [Oldenlandia corymbosa var. corymbosa]